MKITVLTQTNKSLPNKSTPAVSAEKSTQANSEPKESWTTFDQKFLSDDEPSFLQVAKLGVKKLAAKQRGKLFNVKSLAKRSAKWAMWGAVGALAAGGSILAAAPIAANGVVAAVAGGAIGTLAGAAGAYSAGLEGKSMAAGFVKWGLGVGVAATALMAAPMGLSLLLGKVAGTGTAVGSAINGAVIGSGVPVLSDTVVSLLGKRENVGDVDPSKLPFQEGTAVRSTDAKNTDEMTAVYIDGKGRFINGDGAKPEDFKGGVVVRNSQTDDTGKVSHDYTLVNSEDFASKYQSADLKPILADDVKEVVRR